MTQMILKLGDYEDRIVNIIKGKFGFKNKSDAVKYLIDEYGEEILEPRLKPEYIKKAKRIQKEKAISVKDFEKRYGLKWYVQSQS